MQTEAFLRWFPAYLPNDEADWVYNSGLNHFFPSEDAPGDSIRVISVGVSKILGATLVDHVIVDLWVLWKD